MMLSNKVAAVFGGGGAVGAAVARAFAREGAKVYLMGRHLNSVRDLAREIVASGGVAEADPASQSIAEA